MGDMTIPPKPQVPSDPSDQKAMLEYQQKNFEYQFALQVLQNTMNQEQTARSNQAKSKHDAMMAIVNNMKS